MYYLHDMEGFEKVLPKDVTQWFSSYTLEKGWALYGAKRLVGLNFFRRIHKAVCLEDGQIYYCFYFHQDGPVKKLSEFGYCTCLYDDGRMGCEHMAALLFMLFHPTEDGLPITLSYTSSLAYKTAMALCKSWTHKLPFKFFPNERGIRLCTHAGDPVLTWSNPPEHTLPDYIALPGFDIQCSSRHFANFCKKEMGKQDAHLIKFTPKSPTLQEALGPVGDIFRQFFLKAQKPTGRLSYDPGHQLFTLKCSGDGSVGNLSCILNSEQAHILFKSFSESVAPDASAEIHSPAYQKKFTLESASDGGLTISTCLEPPEGGTPFASYESDYPSFGVSRYVPEKGFYVTAVKTSRTARRYCGWKSYRVESKKVVSFLQEFKEELKDEELFCQTEVLKQLTKQADVTGVKIQVRNKKNTRYSLHIHYKIDAHMISLKEILDHREAGETSIRTPSGWIDLECHDFFWLRSLKKGDCTTQKNETAVWMGRSRALRIFGQYKGDNIELDWGPYSELRVLKPEKVNDDEICNDTNIGHLRDYQREGFKWLAYIYKNNISCILADEMGLGKTHQVMALIQHIVASTAECRIVVVCPTSVIYHWRDKLGAFYPGLRVGLYYNKQRNLSRDTARMHVILTTYGIARNDYALLAESDWELIVLDEVQLSKNRDTKTYRALSKLNARTWVGLSGTPIENSSWELKNIFDLLLPGYFPDKETFSAEIASPLEEMGCERAQHYLQRLIRPFLLRRTKNQVLSDLPDLVEENYKCEMTDDQYVMYTITESDRSAIKDMDDEEKPIPYLHIFALMAKLKQICNHPGSLKENMFKYAKYSSGKWELCQTLLLSALENGLKVVIFSQYLNMISIIQKYLKERGIGFQTLVGKTRNRDKVIHQFQNDEHCRVFICSTRAGGAGIDLTAASVVIHYDRWWNSAREEQATARVHRIGQHRNVQVYKLVTINSIEERIDNIIGRKATLVDALFGQDFSNSLKLFTREELREILGYDQIERDPAQNEA